MMNKNQITERIKRDMGKTRKNIVFVKKNGSRKPLSSKDISIKDNQSAVSFTFRNNIWECITSSDYISVGLYGDSIYFIEDSAKDGYKLSAARTKDTRYIQLKKGLGFESFAGNYDLEYDEEEELYFIRKGEY